MILELGSKCPRCEMGELEIEYLDDCTCFMFAPCSACIDAQLECSHCGESFKHGEQGGEEEEPRKSGDYFQNQNNAPRPMVE
ncbi:hypothetical protein OP256_001301 [Vibrio parahaemolyticus]|nr:hypothetical protein [Vibrio parahaemolyticus]